MAEHGDVQRHDNPGVAHETTDVNTKAIAGFAIGVLVVAVVVHLALYWLLVHFRDREARRWEPATLVERADEPPPEPRLQVAPQADLAELRAAEERALHSYGWIDREKNIVRIPIERAMEIIVEEGLPARKKQPAQQEQAAQGDGQSAEGEKVR